MSIELQVLGQPGRDNALLATVSTGKSVRRLLFDCGEGTTGGLPVSWTQEIDAVFFSHFHIDHIAGFDGFFRCAWRRADPPVRLFGPPGATELLHHRMRGFTWNLVSDSPGEVHVHEIDRAEVRVSRFLAAEGFATAHPAGVRPFGGLVHQADGFGVSAVPLSHGTTSLGYVVREHDHVNIDTNAMAAAGLSPGPWVRTVKDEAVPDDREVAVAGTSCRVGDLRRRLLRQTTGDSAAYLTDFHLPDEADLEQLVGAIRGCRTVVCENNYCDADAALARKNYHLTSTEVGALAARTMPERLILFHLSDRYQPSDWRKQLADVRALFPAAEFPAHWALES